MKPLDKWMLAAALVLAGLGATACRREADAQVAPEPASTLPTQVKSAPTTQTTHAGQATPAASDSSTPAPVPSPAPKTVQPFQLTINSNTQAEVDDLRIAAFNFRDENGPSCALQISVRDNGAQDKKLRVHKGETFTASNKTFTVADVGDKVVRLDVK